MRLCPDKLVHYLQPESGISFYKLIREGRKELNFVLFQNGQPAGRYKYQRSLLSNPVPTNPVTVKGQSKDYQQPQPRYLRMKSLHGILANERTEILETNEEDAQEGDISSEMGANQDIAGPSKSNFDKAQYLSGNNESSLGIMPRTSYAISQIIDPSAEQSNYNLLKDQQGSTTSSGQIIGGPHHSLAKSLYNRDTVTNLTANDDDFARMRKRSNCRNEEAGSGENSNEEVKSYAFKSMPFDETTEEREQKELQEERGKHSTTKQHENTEAPWLNPPDKNFDAFKIAQDIILGQQSLSSGAKGNSEGLRSRKVSTKLEHVEGKIESEDVANLNLHSSSQMRNQKPAPILSRRKKNLRSLYVETELEDSNEGASGSKPMEEEFPVPHRVGKMSQLKNIVGKHTPSPTELALQKQQQRLSALGSHGKDRIWIRIGVELLSCTALYQAVQRYNSKSQSHKKCLLKLSALSFYSCKLSVAILWYFCSFTIQNCIESVSWA